jgi:hypothetical protein
MLEVPAHSVDNTISRVLRSRVGGYFPGVVTAPPLLLFAGWLAVPLTVKPVGHPGFLPNLDTPPLGLSNRQPGSAFESTSRELGRENPRH